MKVYPDKLDTQLERSLAPVYLVAGDEPLQVEESLNAIREAAKREGYNEREWFFVEKGFDWNGFFNATASMSLFASRRIIELRLPTGKPGDAGAKALKTYCENPPSDTLLLVASAKVDQRAGWVKALEKTGVLVTAWPIDAKRLPQWIMRRLQGRGVRVDREGAQLIAERVEGNLLAAAQEIEKLVLLTGKSDLDVDGVRKAVADSARYDIFGLVDAALAGDRARVIRSITGLRDEGVEPVLMLWAIAREARDLAKRASKQAGGEPDMKGVWPKRKAVVGSALDRHPRQEWMRFLQRAARIDRVIKGVAAGDPWRELADLLLAIAGPRTKGRAA